MSSHGRWRRRAMDRLVGWIARHPVAIVAVTVVTVAVAIAITLGYRRMVFATFDPEVAEVTGVKVQWVELALMVMLSLTILVTMRVIGTLLISALLVIPASIARMLTKSFARMMFVAPAIGAFIGFFGMFASYHLNTSASATIILVGAVLFVGVYTITGASGRSRIAAMHHL